MNASHSKLRMRHPPEPEQVNPNHRAKTALAVHQENYQHSFTSLNRRAATELGDRFTKYGVEMRLPARFIRWHFRSYAHDRVPYICGLQPALIRCLTGETEKSKAKKINGRYASFASCKHTRAKDVLTRCENAGGLVSRAANIYTIQTISIAMSNRF